jgi:hypothetical protein
MSDRDTEFSPMGTEAASDGTASYSSNGADSGGFGDAGDFRDDGATFLADLAKAMQSTAATEQARNVEATEQRRQAYIDAIRAREALEAEQLRELAKEDVKGIDAWSDGEIKRIKLERERRIASRREQLQIRLEEHHSIVAREVENVEAAVSAYRADVDTFFSRLETETDPVEIARLAGTRPAFPVLELIGPEEAAPISEYTPVVNQTQAHVDAIEAVEIVAAAEAVEAVAAEADEAPEPVEAVAVEAVAAEAVTPDAPEPVEAVATSYEDAGEAVDQGDTGEARDQGDEAVAEGELVGVMDPEASAAPAENPWEGGQEYQGEGQSEDATPVTAEAEAPQAEDDDSSEEPVSVGGEARVVMPRSTGAGSWLRWPNSSADRNDQGR